MVNKAHSVFEQQIADLLRAHGASFEEQPTVGGLRPDFLLTMPDGRRVVVEVKGWPGDSAHLARGIEQVELYRRATGADEALLVVPNLIQGSPPQGVLAAHELGHWLFDQISSEPALKKKQSRAGRGTRQQSSRKRTSDSPPRTVFAAMPFAAEFDDVFFYAIASAAKKIGAVCVRVDKEEFSGDIVEEIRRGISSSIAVIADLSGARPNVLYELGYAHALGKPSVPISSTSLDALPFDVRNWNTISYTVGKTHELGPRLAKRLKAAIGGSTSV